MVLSVMCMMVLALAGTVTAGDEVAEVRFQAPDDGRIVTKFSDLNVKDATVAMKALMDVYEYYGFVLGETSCEEFQDVVTAGQSGSRAIAKDGPIFGPCVLDDPMRTDCTTNCDVANIYCVLHGCMTGGYFGWWCGCQTVWICIPIPIPMTPPEYWPCDWVSFTQGCCDKTYGGCG